jgi:hypothetical protein
MLAALGLREHHYVLELGCGPLGLGRLLIPYLLPCRYFGLESQQSLLEEGVRWELGHDLMERRKPLFLVRPDFVLEEFGVQFDYIMAAEILAQSGEAQVAECLRMAAGKLAPDGLMLISWMPEIQTEYTVTRLQALGQEAGLHFHVMDSDCRAGQSWGAFSLPGCRNVPGARRVYTQLNQLEIIPGAAVGNVDVFRDVGGYLLIAGWALDPESRRPASQVLVADSSGEIRVAIPVRELRTDAAAVHGDPALWSGFRALVAMPVIGDPAKLDCYAVVAGPGRAYLLSGTPAANRQR